MRGHEPVDLALTEGKDDIGGVSDSHGRSLEEVDGGCLGDEEDAGQEEGAEVIGEAEYEERGRRFQGCALCLFTRLALNSMGGPAIDAD